jgi:hypothetical protein
MAYKCKNSLGKLPIEVYVGRGFDYFTDWAVGPETWLGENEKKPGIIISLENKVENCRFLHNVSDNIVLMRVRDELARREQKKRIDNARFVNDVFDIHEKEKQLGGKANVEIKDGSIVQKNLLEDYCQRHGIIRTG